MPVRGRPRLIADKPNSTKLFVDDVREVVRLSQLEKKTISDLIRELVHEAFRYRRLQALARDGGESEIRKLYQAAMQTSLQPVLEQLTQLQQMLDSLTVQNQPLREPVPARPNDRMGAAQLACSSQLLRRVLVTENFVKVLLTVGMQRDHFGAEEIQSQLALPEAAARAETQQFMERLWAEYRLVPPVAAPENRGNET